MGFKTRLLRLFTQCEKGFTLTETIVVMAIVTFIGASAVPAYMHWTNSTDYRRSASNMLYVLRETRSKAVMSNLEHRVEFESAGRRYRVTRGNRASNSFDWSDVVYDWIVLPEHVHMDANVETIHINTDGTANGGAIKIKDAAKNTKYEVRMSPTGRVRIPATL